MKSTHSFIMLTGFTMNSSDMQYYSSYINKFIPKDVKIKYIYPQPPTRKITCYDGQKYRAWFDYLNELVENEDDDINPEHLLEQCKRIHDILDKEVKKYKGDHSKIFICGYSQGACVSLDSGISYPKKIGGVIAFKGHINSDIDKYVKSKQDIWATHSKGDNTIGYDVAEEYYKKYMKLGYNITFFKQGKKVNHDANSGIREQLVSLKPWLLDKL